RQKPGTLSQADSFLCTPSAPLGGWGVLFFSILSSLSVPVGLPQFRFGLSLGFRWVFASDFFGLPPLFPFVQFAISLALVSAHPCTTTASPSTSRNPQRSRAERSLLASPS